MEGFLAGQRPSSKPSEIPSLVIFAYQYNRSRTHDRSWRERPMQKQLARPQLSKNLPRGFVPASAVQKPTSWVWPGLKCPKSLPRWFGLASAVQKPTAWVWPGLNCPKTYLIGLARPQLSKNLPRGIGPVSTIQKPTSWVWPGLEGPLAGQRPALGHRKYYPKIRAGNGQRGR